MPILQSSITSEATNTTTTSQKLAKDEDNPDPTEEEELDVENEEYYHNYYNEDADGKKYVNPKEKHRKIRVGLFICEYTNLIYIFLQYLLYYSCPTVINSYIFLFFNFIFNSIFLLIIL